MLRVRAALLCALGGLAILLIAGFCQAQPLFEDVAPQMGVADSGNCGGLFWFDYDHDSDLDLLQSHRFGGNTYMFRNDGDHFTRLSNLGLPTEWDAGSVIPMDYDHDGDLDLYFPSYHSASLMLAYENGTYVDRSEESGVPTINGARDQHWVDFDHDGWMDILFCHYVEGFMLYRNIEGHFTDVTASTQLPSLATMHTIAEGDADLDGDIDLFITRIDGDERFYVNQGNGVFVDRTAESGLGAANATSGCAWADFNGDKFPDLLTQTPTHHTIWLNNQNLTFDQAIVHGTEAAFFSFDWPHGAVYSVADFDMDYDFDFYAVRPGGWGVGLAPNQLFILDSLRDDEFWFHDAAPALGMDIAADGSSTAADYDNDGDLDLLVSLQGHPCRLYRNNTDSQRSLSVAVEGPNGELDRWHTRVELYPHGGTTPLAVSEISNSNVNCNGIGAYFVLDDQAHYDLKLYFPCGITMTPDEYPQLADIVPSAIDHRIAVRQGVQQPSSAPRPVDGTAKGFRLAACYPNPFNAVTTIRYTLPAAADVRLAVFDVNGRQVTELTHAVQSAGDYQLQWNAAAHASGLYFLRLQAGAQAAQQKVLLLK